MLKRAVFFSLLLVQPIAARTYSVPPDEAIATIGIPDDWEAKQLGDYLDVTTRDGAAHVLVMPVEGRKVAESMGEAMRYIRRTGTVRINADSEKKESITLKGRQVRIFSWDATDKDHPITIRCHIVSGDPDKRLLVVFWGILDAEKKYRPHVNRILESIETPKHPNSSAD